MTNKEELIDNARAIHLRMVMDENKGFRLQLKAVRELHKPVIESNAACGDPDCCGEYEEFELCGDCYCDYPCPTIKLLDGDTDEL